MWLAAAGQEQTAAMNLRPTAPAEYFHSLLAVELAAIETNRKWMHATYLSSEDLCIKLTSISTAQREGTQGSAALIFETVLSVSIRRWQLARALRCCSHASVACAFNITFGYSPPVGVM